jgi:hypothetical protein
VLSRRGFSRPAGTGGGMGGGMGIGLGVTMLVAAGAACSAPQPYAQAGRLLTLPGAEGGAALVPAEASVPTPDAGVDDASTDVPSDAPDDAIDDLAPDAGTFDAP